MTRLHYAILATVLLLAFLLFDRPVDYERPRELTGVERFRLYEATYRAGRYRMNFDNQIITITYEMGGKRVLRREA